MNEYKVYGYLDNYNTIKVSIEKLLDDMEEIAINYDSFVLNETICKIRYVLDDLYNLIEEVYNEKGF